MEPRHFIRRAIALVIDIILFSQLAFYLTAPFANGDSVRLSGGIYQSVACRPVPIEAEAKAYFEARGVSADTGNLCVNYQNGFYAGTDLLVSSEINAEGNIANTAKTLSVALDAQGQQIEPFYPLSLFGPVIVFALIVLVTWLWQGQTLGKKITRVQLVTIDEDYASLLQVFQREALKFAPVILLFILGIFAPQYSLEQAVPLLQKGENIALVLGFLGASTFIYILWWVAPLIWWNGAMPYDKLSKTLVERSY